MTRSLNSLLTNSAMACDAIQKASTACKCNSESSRHLISSDHTAQHGITQKLTHVLDSYQHGRRRRRKLQLGETHSRGQTDQVANGSEEGVVAIERQSFTVSTRVVDSDKKTTRSISETRCNQCCLEN